MGHSNKNKKKGKLNTIVFALEILLLLLLVAGIFAYAKINSGLSMIGSQTGSALSVQAGSATVGRNDASRTSDDKTSAVQTGGNSAAQNGGNTSGRTDANAAGSADGNGPVKTDAGIDAKTEVNAQAPVITPDPNADADAAEENLEVTKNKRLKGYTNIALVGIDTRESSVIDYANSDTMIIASINNDTGEIRLVSIYRDTLLNIGTSKGSSYDQGDYEVNSHDVITAEEEYVDYADDTFDEYVDDAGNDYADDDYNFDDPDFGGEGVPEDNGAEGAPEDNGGEGTQDDGGNGGWTPGYDDYDDGGNGGGYNDYDGGNGGGYNDYDGGNGGNYNDYDTTDNGNTTVIIPSDSEGANGEEHPEYSNNSNTVSVSEETNNGFTGVTSAEGRYDKANAAYCYGSAKQMLTMLNKNLDLNIHDYVVVDFNGVAKLVDDIDGIDVWMTDQEVIHMNNYCVETSKVTGLEYEPIEPAAEPQFYHLNGVQAVSYARIRYTTGNDMKRAQRQRVVINKVVEKAKANGLSAIFGMINDVFPMCKTSLSNSEIIKLASQMFSYEIEKTTGFPFTHLEKDVYVGSKKLDCVVPVTLEENVKELHSFLFDDEDYKCSETVLEYSKDIESLSNLTEKSREAAEKNSIIGQSGGEADVVR